MCIDRLWLIPERTAGRDACSEGQALRLAIIHADQLRDEPGQPNGQREAANIPGAIQRERQKLEPSCWADNGTVIPQPLRARSRVIRLVLPLRLRRSPYHTRWNGAA
jgi:hypothetical protein